jgi:hypothetical protein
MNYWKVTNARGLLHYIAFEIFIKCWKSPSIMQIVRQVAICITEVDRTGLKVLLRRRIIQKLPTSILKKRRDAFDRIYYKEITLCTDNDKKF